MAIRIGVIGTADIANRKMIPAIMQSSEFEYAGVAIASSSEWDEPHTEEEYVQLLENKKEKANDFSKNYGGNTYIGYETLLKDSSIDAVYIPLPPALHYKWGKIALENGKHVLMEKPFCTTFAQTKELLEIANKNKLVVFENYGFIYHKQFEKIKNVFDSGKLGELREIHAVFGFPHRDISDFRYKKKYGGGALLDCGGYTIKAVCEFFKEPEIMYSSLVTPVNYEVDLYGAVVIKDKITNCNAFLSFGMDNSYKCDFELWCKEGSIITNRAFTAPENYDSKIMIFTKDGKEEILCGKTNQFLEVLNKFNYLIKNIPERQKNNNEIIKQARLVSSIIEIKG